MFRRIVCLFYAFLLTLWLNPWNDFSVACHENFHHRGRFRQERVGEGHRSIGARHALLLSPCDASCRLWATRLIFFETQKVLAPEVWDKLIHVE